MFVWWMNSVPFFFFRFIFANKSCKNTHSDDINTCVLCDVVSGCVFTVNKSKYSDLTIVCVSFFSIFNCVTDFTAKTNIDWSSSSWWSWWSIHQHVCSNFFFAAVVKPWKFDLNFCIFCIRTQEKVNQNNKIFD